MWMILLQRRNYLLPDHLNIDVHRVIDHPVRLCVHSLQPPLLHSHRHFDWICILALASLHSVLTLLRRRLAFRVLREVLLQIRFFHPFAIDCRGLLSMHILSTSSACTLSISAVILLTAAVRGARNKSMDLSSFMFASGNSFCTKVTISAYEAFDTYCFQVSFLNI